MNSETDGVKEVVLTGDGYFSLVRQIEHLREQLNNQIKKALVDKTHVIVLIKGNAKYSQVHSLIPIDDPRLKEKIDKVLLTPEEFKEYLP